MRKLRMQFEKSGRAVYISHLDLMHTMQRVFLRSGHRLKYSAGRGRVGYCAPHQ